MRQIQGIFGCGSIGLRRGMGQRSEARKNSKETLELIATCGIIIYIVYNLRMG